MSQYFNYISFGNIAKIEGDSDELSLSEGRMFEYTPVDIEKRLEGLAKEAKGYLTSLPSFLCSEAFYQDDTVRMIVRYGKVHSIEVRSKTVFFNFTTEIDFGTLEFESVEEASRMFELNKFQPYRTHWAVVEGNAPTVLHKLSERFADFQQSVESMSEASAGAPIEAPPLRTKNILGTAKNVEEYLNILFDKTDGTEFEKFYRGHCSEKYELTPSLLRKWPDGSWQSLPNEERMCKELLIAHYDEFQNDQYCFDRLVRMQHYGLPTRLLDISGNPLIALYFACSGSEEQLEESGEVVTFTIQRDSIKYFDSDTASCISNLCNLTDNQKNEIDLSLELENFNDRDVAKKLLHHIKSEKGYFEGRIIPSDLSSILCVKAKRTNIRIRSQSGAFLLYGHEAILPETGNESIRVARITISNKREILSQLDSININATTVYPSIDQTAVHLKDAYLLPKKSHSG